MSLSTDEKITSNPQQQGLVGILELLKNWRFRLNHAQAGHYVVAEKYLRFHDYLGMLLVMLSAFVSCFLFFDFKGAIDFRIRIGVVVAGVFSTVLASVQTFLRPGEKAELHRAKAARYGQLKRQVEVFVAKGFANEKEASDFLLHVETRWDHIADDAPVTPQSVRKRIGQLIESERQLQNAN